MPFPVNYIPQQLVTDMEPLLVPAWKQVVPPVFKYLALNTVTTSFAPSLFCKYNLHEIAATIVGLNSLLTTITVIKAGHERYEVITGHAAYYAAKIVQFWYPQFNSIPAFIITTDQTDLAVRQFECLKPAKMGVIKKAVHQLLNMTNAKEIKKWAKANLGLNYLDLRRKACWEAILNRLCDVSKSQSLPA